MQNTDSVLELHTRPDVQRKSGDLVLQAHVQPTIEAVCQQGNKAAQLIILFAVNDERSTPGPTDSTSLSAARTAILGPSSDAYAGPLVDLGTFVSGSGPHAERKVAREASDSAAICVPHGNSPQ